MPTTSRFKLSRNWAQLRRVVKMECRPCWICHYAIDYRARQGSPLSFHLDHLIPVDKGGEADLDNVAAAHACCNVWRGNRSVAEVNATKAAIVKVYGGWSSPEDFVAKAKALKGKKLVAHTKPTTTTEW